MSESLSMSSEHILATLARAEELLDNGWNVDEVCSHLSVPLETYRLWRRAHYRTFLATARRLDALEQVHKRLAQLLTDQEQEISRLQGLVVQRRDPISQAGD
jgi:hypothetical protein